MNRERGESYGNRAAEVAEAVEFKDEDLDHGQEFQNDADSTWERNNQHLVKFSDELKQVNDQAAADFDHRKNPAEYSLEERREMLDAVVEAFNSASWNSPSERRLAAEDVAHNLFQPMYHRVEIAEAAAQHQMSEEFIETLKQEKIEYLEQKIDDDGLPTDVLEFQVKDYETALRMVEESRGTFHIVSTSRLDHFRDRFADALYYHQWDETARANMDHQLDSAIAYYNGDLGRDDRFGRAIRRMVAENGEAWGEDQAERDLKKDGGEEDPLEALWERGNEHGEPDYRNAVTFGSLESMSAYEMDQEIREILNEELHHVQDYGDQLKAARHPDLDPVRQIQEAMRDMTHDGIQSSVENGNGESFAAIMTSMKGTDQDLAAELRMNAGFIDAEDYEQPALAGRFESIQDMAGYIDRAEDALIDFKDSMSELHHGIAANLLENLDNRVEALEGIQDDWRKAGYSMGDPVPDGVTDPKVFHEDLEEAHRVAAAVDYMLRPRDPELWGIWKEGAEDRSAAFQSILDAKADEARAVTEAQAAGDPERIALVHFGIETARMGIRRAEEPARMDLEDGSLNFGTGTARMGEPQAGEDGSLNEAHEFAARYQPLLDESDAILGYEAMIREGTSDLTAALSPNAGGAFEEFVPDTESPDSVSKQRCHRIEDMVMFGARYQAMVGNDTYGLAGSPRDARMLEYATERYTGAMSEIRNMQDPWIAQTEVELSEAEQALMDEKIREASMCSQLMESLVARREESPE